MNKLFLYISILLVCACCHRKKTIPPEPMPVSVFYWTKYVGTYDVYDTINHTQWVMKISHLSAREQNNGNSDSIYVENFANKFNIRLTWPAIETASHYPAFGLGIFHPIKDQHNYKWHLACAWDDSTTVKEENVLKNDTMTIYFTLSNIAYYVNDGVPYYDCDCKHIAVKRH